MSPNKANEHEALSISNKNNQAIVITFDMKELFITEHFIKLKCDRQRRLWEYKFLSAEKIIRTLMNDEETSEEDMSSSE